MTVFFRFGLKRARGRVADVNHHLLRNQIEGSRYQHGVDFDRKFDVHVDTITQYHARVWQLAFGWAMAAVRLARLAWETDIRDRHLPMIQPAFGSVSQVEHDSSGHDHALQTQGPHIYSL